MQGFLTARDGVPTTGTAEGEEILNLWWRSPPWCVCTSASANHTVWGGQMTVLETVITTHLSHVLGLLHCLVSTLGTENKL